MKLREKIEFEVGDNCEHSSYCTKKSCNTSNGIKCYVDKQTVDNLETICDEFAIGFAEWITDSRNENVKGSISIEELLQIYKDENKKSK